MKCHLPLLLVIVLPTPVWSQGPPLMIRLGDRHGHATPNRAGCTHLAGGNIDIEQPEPNELLITMTGAAVATGHPFTDSLAGMDFDLEQDLKIVFREPQKIKSATLSLEAKVIGLLRSRSSTHDHTSRGTASCGPACAELLCADHVLLAVCAPPHSVGGGENLSVNCQSVPPSIPILPGCYRLHQAFRILAAHPHGALPCWPASAEFAPDALNEKWIGYWEPFHGAKKSKFGFQVRLRIEPEELEALSPLTPSK